MTIKQHLSNVWGAMKRTKQLSKDSMETPLQRCLTTFDLTLLGIGNMAGSGIYVLTGTVIRDKAGPATFLSYLIAGCTALLNSFCYAELGSRIPKAGSAYTYTYVAGGEFLAFVIGWSVILEYVLSVASVARGWSGTIDTMVKGAITNGTIDTIGRFPSGHWLAEYPDLIAFSIVLVLGLLLAAGPKLSVNFNSVITTLNIFVIVLATILMYSNPYPGGALEASSQRSFLPNHFSGVISGAGTCFYAFIGFDAITVSCEEASNPKKSMPFATAISVSFVTTLFVLSSLALTLYVPYDTVSRSAAFTAAFKARGVDWATYVTGIGSLLGISASLFTSMYALPRIVYAMAQDGLIPRFLGHIVPSTKVPVVGLAIFGLLAAILALLFDIHTLADFLSIGTLIAYTIVNANLVILRYRKPQYYHEFDEEGKAITESEESGTGWAEENIGKLKAYFANVPILRSMEPGDAPIAALVIMIILSAGFCSLVLVGTEYLTEGSWWAVILLILLIVGIIMCVGVMLMHDQYRRFDTFKVPFVPVMPCITILLNITLIVKLSPMTWVRFAIWLAIGLVIYFGYGLRNSSQRDADLQLPESSPSTHTESTKLVTDQMPLVQTTEYPQPRYDNTKSTIGSEPSELQ